MWSIRRTDISVLFTTISANFILARSQGFDIGNRTMIKFKWQIFFIVAETWISYEDCIHFWREFWLCKLFSIKLHMQLPTCSQPSHPGVHFRCCRIFPAYKQKFLSIPAKLPMRNSQLTSQEVYLTVDSKDSFTDYGSVTENEFLSNEEIWIARSNLYPKSLLWAKCVRRCLDPFSPIYTACDNLWRQITA